MQTGPDAVRIGTTMGGLSRYGNPVPRYAGRQQAVCAPAGTATAPYKNTFTTVVPLTLDQWTNADGQEGRTGAFCGARKTSDGLKYLRLFGIRRRINS